MRRTGEEHDHPTDQDKPLPGRCVDFRSFSVRYFAGGYCAISHLQANAEATLLCIIAASMAAGGYACKVATAGLSPIWDSPRFSDDSMT
jgi:hypothetical protein